MGNGVFIFYPGIKDIFWAGRRAGQHHSHVNNCVLSFFFIYLFLDKRGESSFSPCFGLMRFAFVKKKRLCSLRRSPGNPSARGVGVLVYGKDPRLTVTGWLLNASPFSSAAPPKLL